MLQGALSSTNPILRCAAGEALGRMAQVVGDSKFIAEMAQYSFDKYVMLQLFSFPDSILKLLMIDYSALCSSTISIMQGYWCFSVILEVSKLTFVLNDALNFCVVAILSRKTLANSLAGPIIIFTKTCHKCFLFSSYIAFLTWFK